MRHVSFQQLILLALAGAAAPMILKKAMPPKKPQKNPSNLPETSIAEPVEMAVMLVSGAKITKGKTCAQVGHAIAEADSSRNPLVDAWRGEGVKVTFFKVPDFDSCKEKIQIAQKMPMPADFVCDAGHTEVAPGTVTVGWVLGESLLIEELMKDLEPLK